MRKLFTDMGVPCSLCGERQQRPLMMAGSHAVLGVVLVTSILTVVGSVDPEVHMDAVSVQIAGLFRQTNTCGIICTRHPFEYIGRTCEVCRRAL